MHFGGSHRTRITFAAITAALVLAAALIIWIEFSPYPLRESSAESSAGASRSRAGDRFISGDTVVPAEVSVAMLCDYYEHGVEHAPPRDPSGVMQRRERFYITPPSPFRFLKAHLQKSVPDDALARWASAWEEKWRSGAPVAKADLLTCEYLANHCSLNAFALLNLGRGFDYLAGDEMAACWFRAGLAKAEIEYKAMRSGDPTALKFLRTLDQTKALWRLKDFEALETRFSLARRLNPELSVEARRAGYLYADMLFARQRNPEAATAILEVQRENEIAGDLGHLERSDITEMAWTIGLFLYSADRFQEAIPRLRVVVESPGEHTSSAYPLLIAALATSREMPEANKRMGEYARAFHPTPEQAMPLFELLDGKRVVASAAYGKGG